MEIAKLLIESKAEGHGTKWEAYTFFFFLKCFISHTTEITLASVWSGFDWKSNHPYTDILLSLMLDTTFGCPWSRNYYLKERFPFSSPTQNFLYWFSLFPCFNWPCWKNFGPGCGTKEFFKIPIPMKLIFSLLCPKERKKYQTFICQKKYNRNFKIRTLR